MIGSDLAQPDPLSPSPAELYPDFTYAQPASGGIRFVGFLLADRVT